MRASSRAPLTRRLGPIAVALAAAGCSGTARGPLLSDPSPVFRGHREIDVASARAPLPRVIGRAGPVGFCLEVPAETDTSQWEARLLGDAYAPPAVRLDATLCFEGPIPAALGDGDHELCALLRDRYDGTTQGLPCLPFRIESDDRALADLEGRLPAAIAQGAPALDALSTAALAGGFYGLALRARLIAAYALRREGTEAARAGAALRLREDPPWVRAPAAARWAGPLDYERASLALDAHADLAGCWRLLRDAERSFRLAGDRKWIAIAGKQAEVLSRAGALAEAKERLRFAVAACGSAPCEPSLVRAAESTWAWLIASDPDATGEEIDGATRRVEAILAGDAPPQDRLERANLLLNEAFLEARRGRPPSDALVKARELLGADRSARARDLAGWADLAEGRRYLLAGDSRRALVACDSIASAGGSPRLRAHAASCAAAARRRLGDLVGARAGYATALALHAASIATPLAQEEPLGPSQQAEDAYAAARVEIELGRPDNAWSILRALDDGAAAPPPAASAPLEPWLAILKELETPSSARRREQREAIRWATLDRMREAIGMQELATSEPTGDETIDFRAFPLDDEVIVLRRSQSGTIGTYRRTAMPRDVLVGTISAACDALERGAIDDARWDGIVVPLGRALAPRAEDLGAATTFAMHGILQEVPLAALRVPSDGAPRWLADVTVPVHRPAGAGRAANDGAGATGRTVVVSDPRGDLGPEADAERVSGFGRAATILGGGAASREALRSALSGATLLHLDAHARYEPAFPELSTILLADGAATGQELAAWAPSLRLANLSGCATGRAPVSADSGRFGIAGLLARSGVAWVVAARALLANAAAADFNRAFYAALDEGATVPQAFGRGLEAARARRPASQWGAFLLLRGADGNPGGQSPVPRTPYLAGGVR